MKKLIIFTLLVAYSHISNAQKVAVVNGDTTPENSRNTSINEPLKKENQEVKVSGKVNKELKQQIKQLKSESLRTGSKVIVTRTGSKQVTVE